MILFEKSRNKTSDRETSGSSCFEDGVEIEEFTFSSDSKKRLITSALPYVNNIPHLGNIIGSVLSADVFARYSELAGYNTIYICGADEHGTATETKALEENTTPEKICDKYYNIHKEIYEWFNIDFERFGRTSTEEHVSTTQNLFTELDENGYIEEKEVDQTFCEECDKFLADRFVEGTCPHCGYEEARGDQCESCGKLLSSEELEDPLCKMCSSTPVIKSSQQLFLCLDKLQSELENWAGERSEDGFWTKNAVKTTEGWFEEGLEPRSITRDLDWGVSVPKEGFENNVFYVWFDAPIGYISITKNALPDSWREWWLNPEGVDLYQFMAKDNIPFHTLFFPATLLGADDDFTMLHHINSTEYLNYEGGKFSKSRNVGLFGDDAMDSGLDADLYRYYLLSVRPETSDTVFKWEGFRESVNRELIANFGNLVNRTLSFIERYFDSSITDVELGEEDKEFWKEVIEEEKEIVESFEKVELKSALERIMSLSKKGNTYFQREEPWEFVEAEKGKNDIRAQTILYVLLNLVRDLGLLLSPYIPESTKEMFLYSNLDMRGLEDLGRMNIEVPHIINKFEVLFEKVSKERIEELEKKYSGKESEAEEEVEEDEAVSFSDLDLVVGEIVGVAKHTDADNLYVEEVDIGGEEPVQIVSGLVPHYEEEELLGMKVVFLKNLEQAEIRGVVSEGMLLAVEGEEDRVEVLHPGGSPGDPIGVMKKDGSQTLSEKDGEVSRTLSIEEFSKVDLYVEEGRFMAEGEEVKVRTDSGVESIKVEDIEDGRVK